MQKIIKLEGDTIKFTDGYILYSEHEQDCCESHSIEVGDIEFDEVKDLEFDLTLPFEELIEKVEGYGIRLKSSNNFPLSIPGYGWNNGFYSADLTLILAKEENLIGDISDTKIIWSESISECQEIEE